MKKALIITYYWPPSGGAGVQRWLKFAKYLRDYGWEPVIYTPENPEYPAVDHSLEKDIADNITVLKTKIKEPYNLYKRFVGRKKSDQIKSAFLSEKKTPALAEKISVWIRGNFFIPDARVFWIKPSVKYLIEYLSLYSVDAIISTGPPHSMHMIALKAHQKTGLPWVADFRDPWTHIDYYKDLKLTAFADRKHHKLEKQVLSKANRVVVVSQGMKSAFETIHKRHYDVITNGFDDEDIPKEIQIKSNRFTIAHIGSLTKSRNPETLWLALNKITNQNKQFAQELEIKIIGKADWVAREAIRNAGIEKYVEYIDYLPHDMVVQEQVAAGVLLLIINRTENAKMIVTGKLFEYLAARRPILCIGPADGDASAIIRQTDSGLIADYDDQTLIESHLERLHNAFLTEKQLFQYRNIESYTRKNLTKELAVILDSI